MRMLLKWPDCSPTTRSAPCKNAFPHHRTAAAILKDRKAEAATVRQLREWIEREIHLDLTHAPFDAQDETLLPSAGSCAKCPKRTGNNPLLFPEVRQKSICTDRACYRRKVEALVQLRVKPLEAAGEKPLRVSQAPAWQARHPKTDVLHEGQYRTAQRKAECPQTKPAVVIDGPEAGKLLHVCRDEQCPVHARVTRYQPSPQGTSGASQGSACRAHRETNAHSCAERDSQETARDTVAGRPRNGGARLLRAAGPRQSSPPLPRVRLGREKDQVHVGRATPWTAGISREKAVREMSMQQVQHFLIVCALVSDLYCPGYNPRQALAKDSKLARTALRYKIDTGNLAAEVRTELLKKNKGNENFT